MAAESTGKKCLVCRKGEIIKETTEVFVSLYGPPIDGPGEEKQRIEKTDYYCENCGVMYRFLP